MDARFTHIRPSSEHVGKTPARWFFYREDENGKVHREEAGELAMGMSSRYLYFVDAPDLFDPQSPEILPRINGQRGIYGIR